KIECRLRKDGPGKPESRRMEPSQSDVTSLLKQFTQGDKEAAEKLIPLVYDELKRLARSYMRREPPDHTLQTTALVHEAYLKLICQRTANWQSRSHFFGIAAQLMRRILIDHARGQLREKRGGGKAILPLKADLAFSPEQSEELMRLDEALDRLSVLDPRQGKVVELRFFGGLSVEETSGFLGVSPKTVKRDWVVAKAWLHAELRRGDGDVTQTMGPR
ncbi:MAG: sigma-70 family RNA polymerase sigma factor, partial [Chthoniobacterales bacterium]